MKPKIFSIVFVVGMCVCTYALGQTHEKKEPKQEVQIESTKVSEKIAEALNPAFVFRNTLFYLDRNNDKLRAYMDIRFFIWIGTTINFELIWTSTNFEPYP